LFTKIQLGKTPVHALAWRAQRRCMIEAASRAPRQGMGQVAAAGYWLLPCEPESAAFSDMPAFFSAALSVESK
jgi:hypothetical protein